jgi:chromate transporter
LEGALGALAMTAGIFLPAFGFSLLLYRRLEAVVENPHLHHFLEGVTAGVVGLIVATLFDLGHATLTNGWAIAIFALCLVPLYLWKSKAVIPLIIVGAGVVGLIVFGGLNR